MEGDKIMNTNEIIRLLQDFQKLRFDLFKESQISALGKKIKTLYETTEKEVKFQELDSQIYELNHRYYQKYFNEKLKSENVGKPPKTKDVAILEKYLEELKSVYAKYENDLKARLAQLKKVQKVQDNESIQILSQCNDVELAELELISNVKLRKEISAYKESKLVSSQNKKTLNAFKKAEKKLLDVISKIKQVRETGLV